MTSRSLSDASGAPAAINAFLRGIERRSAVFAELQCGNAAAGDAALAAAMRAFHAGAGRTPMSQWPQRFWGLLLATPMLRRAQPLPARTDALAALGRIGHGPRAALLLRLAAGLGEADAAAALGIAPATYRLALQRALPRRADGGADAETWRALAMAVQSAIRTLPPQRLAHLARLRETALQPAPAGAMRAPRATAPTAGVRALPSRRRTLALGASATLCVAALAATFLWSPPQPESPGAGPRIRKVSLPEAEAPAARYDAHTALLSDRDFELLLDAGDEPVYRQLDFYSWYAAQAAQATTAMPVVGNAAVPAQDATPEPETSDAAL
ncbi:hypothetical protein IP90_02207 [Luteimonas cucumeris]|uniref:Uncharacterized protein n=1 Tax=Luteimonas cucumeris TaxID=985012 RepID=A0A562L1Z9_9GAMM|nr:hypothetical protein [Luteimonas cucumeris]TWI01648.1 hypothetical protein IP90_02207 [Luteimonas cucumeris]